jgi:hypothetical protein
MTNRELAYIVKDQRPLVLAGDETVGMRAGADQFSSLTGDSTWEPLALEMTEWCAAANRRVMPVSAVVRLEVRRGVASIPGHVSWSGVVLVEQIARRAQNLMLAACSQGWEAAGSVLRKCGLQPHDGKAALELPTLFARGSDHCSPSTNFRRG